MAFAYLHGEGRETNPFPKEKQEEGGVKGTKYFYTHHCLAFVNSRL